MFSVENIGGRWNIIWEGPVSTCREFTMWQMSWAADGLPHLVTASFYAVTSAARFSSAALYCVTVELFLSQVFLYLREPGSQSPEKLENLSGGPKNTSVRPHPTRSESVFFNYFFKIAYVDLFLFGCAGSSLLHVGLLCWR